MLGWSTSTDTDFAGCGRTRKFTYGGVVMFDSRCLKTYSQPQETIALSSGEFEFYGILMAATMGVCVKSISGDLGLEVEAQVNTDSRFARSISPKVSGEFDAWRCESCGHRRRSAEE